MPAAQSMTAVQQIECVLRYFSLRITDADIFSRCMVSSSSSAFFLKTVNEVICEFSVVYFYYW